jgi:hypothetical protein
MTNLTAAAASPLHFAKRHVANLNARQMPTDNSQHRSTVWPTATTVWF